MKEVYSLVSENLTHVGGNMGTEYTYPNWTKYFSSIDFAKQFAEKDYNKGRKEKETIRWRRSPGKNITSGDLGYVMYHITPIKIER